jgi:hypothetical protein
MVVQADLWMERHLCETVQNYAHLYAIRDKLMGSMVGAHRWLQGKKVCSVPELHDFTLWHLDSSVQWCTRLDARPDMAGIFGVLCSGRPRHSWALLPAYRC